MGRHETILRFTDLRINRSVLPSLGVGEDPGFTNGHYIHRDLVFSTQINPQKNNCTERLLEMAGCLMDRTCLQHTAKCRVASTDNVAM